MSGSVGILNVGCGDTKLVFDKDNPQDCIRAARIVKDMIRRGYALLVENPPDSKQFTRVYEFRESTFEYVIADFDPEIAQKVDAAEGASELNTIEGENVGISRSRRKGKARRKAISATNTRAVAVPHRAGG